LTCHARHITSLLEIEGALNKFIHDRKTSSGDHDEASAANHVCLIEILCQQPFCPNYASAASPYIAHLSDLLAGQSEHQQTHFLLLILKVGATQKMCIEIIRILSLKPHYNVLAASFPIRFYCDFLNIMAEGPVPSIAK
jgi:hypothetical protein